MNARIAQVIVTLVLTAVVTVSLARAQRPAHLRFHAPAERELGSGWHARPPAN